jgi:hypothetical protein
MGMTVEMETLPILLVESVAVFREIQVAIHLEIQVEILLEQAQAPDQAPDQDQDPVLKRNAQRIKNVLMM